MTRRWLLVLGTVVALVAIPVAVSARSATESTLSAANLTAKIQASAGRGWSGSVETSGALQLPESDSFATLGELLGGANSLRAWWRDPANWRVDRLRSSGETDLYRSGRGAIRWVFESQTATVSPVSKIRLPDASDLLPPTLARSMVRDARPAELSRRPARLIAGVCALGLRLVPDDPAGTIDHVDLWADPETGLAVRVELYGSGDVRPILISTMTSFDPTSPATGRTTFRPAAGVRLAFDQSVDVAAAANASAPFDLPPTLAGLPARGGDDPGAVGVYGRGPTTLFALPIRGSVARPIRDRLRDSPDAQETGRGTYAPVGPVGVLVSARPVRGGFLLAGTVSAETLQRAAAELGVVA